MSESYLLKIGSTKEINITRNEAHFDRACDEAHRYALAHFKIDEDGHSLRVVNWNRSSCWIEISFCQYIRIQNMHVYKFIAKTQTNDNTKPKAT